MYLGIFIINFILYILEITYKTIEKFNDYENGLNHRILKSATAIEKNNKNILVPDTNTIKIFKSSFL
tara:strand:- start:28653 stop:28853 length:201 start_codon:yes stop_codon:yes gene_type:complete